MKNLKKPSNKRIVPQLIIKNGFHHFFIATLLLCSCSIIRPRKTPDGPSDPYSLFTHHLQAICLTGEGRGKFQADQETNSFSFESKWNSPRGFWVIALNFPLQGEKLIQVNWEQVLEENVQVSAPSLEMMFQGPLNKEDKLNKEMVLKFIQDLGMFFYLYEGILNNNQSRPINKYGPCTEVKNSGVEQGDCIIKGKTSYKTKWNIGQDNFLLELGSSGHEGDTFLFSIIASKLSETHYKKIQFSLKMKNEFSGLNIQKLLSLDLYMPNCIIR